MELEGKVAVITGGGSGIGESTAQLFAREGARVVICGRTREKLEETKDSAGDVPGEIVDLQADIADSDDMEALFEQVDERFGRLDVLFAHAGINGVWAPIEELRVEEWRQTIDVNLTGTFHTVKYATPLLKRQGGSIIITSSINGTAKFTDVGATAYCATKAGQVAFMKLMALELADAGVRVNAICPGAIATSIDEHTELRNTEAAHEIAEFPHGSIPLTGGDPGSPEQVAELVLFLASDRSSHITGTPIWIDGGQSIAQG